MKRLLILAGIVQLLNITARGAILYPSSGGVPSTPAATNAILNVLTNNNGAFANGILNRVAKFTPDVHTLGNSLAIEVSSNMWAWNTALDYTPRTNSWTNRIYGSSNSTTIWRAFDMVAGQNGNTYNFIQGSSGSADTSGIAGGIGILPLQLNGAMVIESATPILGHTAGYVYPSTDGLQAMGTTSARWHGFVSDALGFVGSASAPGNIPYGLVSGMQMTFGVTNSAINNSSGGEIVSFDTNPQNNAAGVDIDTTHFLMGGGPLGQPGAYFGMPAVNIYQLGTNNTAPAMGTAQVLRGLRATGVDSSGGDLIIAGGPSDGAGTNGAVRIQTAQKSASGGTGAVNTNADRVVITAEPVGLTTNVATLVLQLTLPTALKHLGCLIVATTTITDGTDQAVVTESFTWNALNKAGTVTTHVSSPAQTDTLATGGATATTTWTATVVGTTISLKNKVVTGTINATTSTCELMAFINSNDGARVITTIPN